MDEQTEFEIQLQEIHPQDREGVMEIVTSWMEKGLEKGLEKGERKLLLRLLRKRLGGLDRDTEQRIDALPPPLIEQLGDALLDFTARDDLDSWLRSNS